MASIRRALVLYFTPRSANQLWSRLTEDQLQLLAAEPRDNGVGLVEPSRYQQGIVCAALKSHLDVPLVDSDLCGSINEVPEQMPGLSDLVAVADLRARSRYKLLAISVN